MSKPLIKMLSSGSFFSAQHAKNNAWNRFSGLSQPPMNFQRIYFYRTTANSTWPTFVTLAGPQSSTP